MKWRCEWCGKPQAKNDPPCDNCGHHAFERAVVPQAPEDSHEEVVWLCPECGRTSPKNNPPCSRCGNMHLERRSADYLDPGEIGGTGWRDVLEWWHLVVGAILLLVGATVALGVVGIIDLPGAPGEPTVENPPGSADEANGISLPTAERQFVDKLNDQRTAAGLNPLERDDTFQAMATYYNQRIVEAIYADGSVPGEDWSRQFDWSCAQQPTLLRPSLDTTNQATIDQYESSNTLASEMLEQYNQKEFEQPQTSLGVDVHVGPDGAVFVTHILC